MRPESLNVLFKEITSLAGVGDKTASFIKKLCGPYLIDMLFHLPVGVNHRPFIEKASQIKFGQYATVQVQIQEHLAPPRKRGPYRIFGEIVNFSQEIELIFFNYHTVTIPTDCNSTFESISL